MRELTKEVLDQLIFGMENQERKYLFDLNQTRLVETAQVDDCDDDLDCVDLPVWRSVDGYNLMERFVGELKNPLVRHQLLSILQSGRGVFRQFKDCLKEHREVERLWFQFKDREMKRRVVDWYNSIRESRGLEALKDDFLESEDLVLSDFSIVLEEDVTRLEQVKELDRRSFDEQFEDELMSAYWYAFRRDHLPEPEELENGSLVICVYTPDEVISGFLWAIHDELSSTRAIGHILQLYVCPEYRGLGIASALLERYLQNAREEELELVSLEHWESADFIADMLSRQGFERTRYQYEFNLKNA